MCLPPHYFVSTIVQLVAPPDTTTNARGECKRHKSRKDWQNGFKLNISSRRQFIRADGKALKPIPAADVQNATIKTVSCKMIDGEERKVALITGITGQVNNHFALFWKNKDNKEITKKVKNRLFWFVGSDLFLV